MLRTSSTTRTVAFMSFETPPRGSGKHWRTEAPTPSTPARERFRPGRSAGYPEHGETYHPADDDDTPTDPTMRIPLNRAPRRDVGEGERRITVSRANGPRYQDMVIPRVYVEPDEAMDRLRQRAMRWGIIRDAVIVAVGVYLLLSWVLPAVVRWWS